MQILYTNQLKHRFGSKFNSKTPSVHNTKKPHAYVERTQLIGQKV